MGDVLLFWQGYRREKYLSQNVNTRLGNCMQIPEVHAQLQPFLGGMPCTIAQLRAVARQLGEDDSIEVYFDPTEDRVILN